MVFSAGMNQCSNTKPGKAPACQLHGLSSPAGFLLFSFLLPVSPVLAETMFVDDTLRVGVRLAPDSREAPVNVVTTGMKLEVLDKRDGFLRIKTAEGIEGWIKEAYASKDKPAIIRLEVLQKEHDKLRKEYHKLGSQAQETSEANRVLVEEAKRLKQENIDLHLQLVREKETGIARDPDHGKIWLVIGGLFAAVFFFAAGAAWYRYIMSKRFGGLRL